MSNMLKRKINNCTGESIAESLVSILIVAVASIMFAGMVTASRSIIDTSSKWMQNYYIAVSAINEQRENTDPEVKKGSVDIDIAGDKSFEDVMTYSYEVAGIEIISYVPPTPTPSVPPAPVPVGG